MKPQLQLATLMLVTCATLTACDSSNSSDQPEKKVEEEVAPPVTEKQAPAVVTKPQTQEKKNKVEKLVVTPRLVLPDQFQLSAIHAVKLSSTRVRRGETFSIASVDAAHLPLLNAWITDNLSANSYMSIWAAAPDAAGALVFTIPATASLGIYKFGLLQFKDAAGAPGIAYYGKTTAADAVKHIDIAVEVTDEKDFKLDDNTTLTLSNDRVSRGKTLLLSDTKSNRQASYAVASFKDATGLMTFTCISALSDFADDNADDKFGIKIPADAPVGVYTLELVQFLTADEQPGDTYYNKAVYLTIPEGSFELVPITFTVE